MAWAKLTTGCRATSIMQRTSAAGSQFIKQAGDYMPMHDFLRSPAADFRGLIDNAFGYEVRDEWQPVFGRLSCACGTGAETLANNEWSGRYWADRAHASGVIAYLARQGRQPRGRHGRSIANTVKYNLLAPPPVFPRHALTHDHVQTRWAVRSQWRLGAAAVARRRDGLQRCLRDRRQTDAARVSHHRSQARRHL